MRGVLSSSTRTARILRWLETFRSDKAVMLRLEVADPDEGVSIVATWDRAADSWNPSSVASEADASIQNVADETGARTKGRLCWVTELGAVWTAMPLFADPEQGAVQLDGTSKAQAQQAQRHLEAMAITYNRGTAGVMDDLHKVVGVMGTILEKLGERINRSDEELGRLREENAQLSRDAADAEQAADIAAETAEEAVQTVQDLREQSKGDASVLQLVGKVLANGEAKKP